MKPLRGKRVDPQKSTRRIQLVGGQLRCDMMGAVRGSRLSALRSRSSDVCTFSGLSATTGFVRRSEELGAGGPPTASCCRLGVIALGSQAAGRPRIGRPAVAPALACTSRPVATALWAVAANRECAVGGVLGGAQWSVASRSVIHPTRLETRTKESNMCASHWVVRNLKAK